MLLRIDGEKVLLIVVAMSLVFLVGHAQSRFDACKSIGQKSLSCVLQFN